MCAIVRQFGLSQSFQMLPNRDGDPTPTSPPEFAAVDMPDPKPAIDILPPRLTIYYTVGFLSLD